MVTVTTKSQLKSAIENKQFPIHCCGEVAELLKKKRKRTKKAVITGASLTIGGILAIPFTGGTSAAATGVGLSTLGLTVGGTALTVGALTISAAELAILVGGGVAITAILKGRKVTFKEDGSVVVE